MHKRFFFTIVSNNAFHFLTDNREEKSLRHVAMVVKFLDDNKPKI